jgi:hypothetical protein
MPSLTTLHLGRTVARARCLLRVVGARASVVGRQLAPCASACGRAQCRMLGGGLFEGRSGCAACAARRQPDRSLGRYCAGGGAAADAEPHDAPSQRYGHACALRASCCWGSRIGGWAAARAVCFGVRACGRMLGDGLFGVGGAVRLAPARRQPDRRLGRHRAGGGAAADAEPHDARSRRYGHACALRASCRWGFVSLGLAHRRLGGSLRRVLRRAGVRSDVGRRAF